LLIFLFFCTNLLLARRRLSGIIHARSESCRAVGAGQPNDGREKEKICVRDGEFHVDDEQLPSTPSDMTAERGDDVLKRSRSLDGGKAHVETVRSEYWRRMGRRVGEKTTNTRRQPSNKHKCRGWLDSRAYLNTIHHQYYTAWCIWLRTVPRAMLPLRYYRSLSLACPFSFFFFFFFCGCVGRRFFWSCRAAAVALLSFLLLPEDPTRHSRTTSHSLSLSLLSFSFFYFFSAIISKCSASNSKTSPPKFLSVLVIFLLCLILRILVSIHRLQSNISPA